MRVYHISCPGCFWKAPLPVDSTVAQKFRERVWCINCEQLTPSRKVKYVIREVIVTGPTPYFPRKS